MSIASLSGAASAATAQQLQKQAQSASAAASDLARQFQQQAEAASAATSGIAQQANAPQHGHHGGTGVAESAAQDVVSASGLSRVA